MNKNFNSLNLNKYLPFFQQNAECPCTLALFSYDGNLIQQANGDPGVFEILTKHIEKFDFNNSGSLPEPNITDFGADGRMTKIAIMLPHYEQMHWLAGLLKSPAGEMSSTQQAKASETLITIADCIIDDYTLQLTLNGMVEELTVRYEELNLLYGLDDVDSHQLSMDEKQAISHLINNCIDYMNVDLAVFYAPNLDLLIHKSTTQELSLDLNSTLELIQNSLYRYIASTEKTLVINQNRDADWTNADLDTLYKILAAPVMFSKDNMAGLLVLIKTSNKPDFSNSDRKLCDVLASEAAKLIQARRDSITGLINRRGFTEKLQQAQALIKTYPLKFSLLFIDIDQFKVVNDTSGQKAGDRLLNHITGIITNTLIDHHTIGRLGADEFGVLLENHEATKAEQTAEKLCEAINKFRFSYEDKLFDISVCIGVAELNSEANDYSTTLSSAALACVVAKEQGRNRVHVYHPSDQDMIRHENEMHWVSRINLALEQERFLLYKQKILPLQGNPDSEEHYEILLRLKDENGNLIPPFNFIPSAERYNLMSKLDRWVVKTTLEKIADVIQKNPESKLSCSINLSGQSFCEPRFAEFIIDQINETKVPTNRICLEITETAAVSNLSQTVKFIESLKIIGCSFSLDDFGSGMSSFTYLKTLPVDYLKIDVYFVKTMTTNAIDYAMVKSIHEIGHVMGLKTVAEFVENDDILQELVRLGVDYGQGYGIAKPEPFE
jgi:diguanylate cyclase (GGDEF)-like protein